MNSIKCPSCKGNIDNTFVLDKCPICGVEAPGASAFFNGNAYGLWVRNLSRPVVGVPPQVAPQVVPQVMPASVPQPAVAQQVAPQASKNVEEPKAVPAPVVKKKKWPVFVGVAAILLAVVAGVIILVPSLSDNLSSGKSSSSKSGKSSGSSSKDVDDGNSSDDERNEIYEEIVDDLSDKKLISEAEKYYDKGYEFFEIANPIWSTMKDFNAEEAFGAVLTKSGKTSEIYWVKFEDYNSALAYTYFQMGYNVETGNEHSERKSGYTYVYSESGDLLADVYDDGYLFLYN